MMRRRLVPGGKIKSPRRRSFRWLLVGLLVTLVAATLAVTLTLVNGEAAKAAIERQLATHTGTDIRYETLDLRVWPGPVAELHQVTFRVTPDIEGTVERVALEFALLPLLKGDVRISLARIERPALVVRISAFRDAPAPEGLVAAYRDAVDPILGWLALYAREVAFVVRDGTVDLAAPGWPTLRLDALTVDGEVSSETLEARIEAHANIWRDAHAHARIETGSLAASLELQIDQLEAAPLFERALAASPVKIAPAASAITLLVETDGTRAATAQLSVAMSGLGITRNGSRLDVGASRARVRATYSPPETALAVEELRVGDLLAGATGSLKFRPGEGGTVLDAAIGRVDGGRLRAAALGLANDLGLVRTLATSVQRGIALDLRAHVAGDGLEILADPLAYELSTDVEAADIDVPPLALRLSGTSGSVRIAQRVLSARGVAATIGRSSLRDGNMVLALGPTVALRELSAALDVDLAESLELAKRVLRNSAKPSVFSRIQSITGRAKGTLVLREAGRGFHQTYDVTSLQGTLRHTAVPLPIVIDGGGLRYETGGRFALRGLAGAVGASRIERIDAALALTPEPVVLSAAGAAMLDLDELYPWAAASLIARSLRDGVSALTGTIGVKLARLAGPLRAPERLDFVAALVPQQVRIVSRHLPAPLNIAGGTIRIDGADVGVDGVSVALLDARGRLSGSLRAYASPARALDVSIAHAAIGPRSLEWTEDAVGIAPDARVRAPIAIERARIKWPAPPPWRLEVDAAAVFPSGAHSDLDFSWRPGIIAVRQFTLKDQDSDFRVVLDREPERAEVMFRGVLSGRSVGRILVAPLGASGTLRGDFEAAVDLRDPIRSHATGKLEGTDIGIPTTFATPLLIDRIAIEADGDRFSARDTVLRFAGELLTLTGTIARVGDEFDVDADIKVNSIDAERLLAELRNMNAIASPWAWPLRGQIAVRAGRVDVLGYRVEPFVAAVALGDRKVTANVSEAGLCGLAVLFTLLATPETVEVKGRATAQDLPVAGATTCLTKNMLRASGTMDISADFAASGAPAALLASARGSARLRARNGRVGGVAVLSEVLTLEEVNERLAGADLDTGRDGWPYRAIEIDASLVGQRVVVDRALLESLALDIAIQGEIRIDDGHMALTGVALPVVNAIVRQAPLVGRAAGGPIVGIPFSVRGNPGNPEVKRVGATAIAGALLGTLQSVVTLPVQLLGAGPGDAGGDPGASPRDPP